MLVRREPGTEAEWHGLVLPESVRKTDHIVGVVVRGGPMAPYSEGQRVVMARTAGTGVALDGGDELAFVTEMDVLALVDDEPAGAAA